MTVKELIEELKKYPENTDVYMEDSDPRNRINTISKITKHEYEDKEDYIILRI